MVNIRKPTRWGSLEKRKTRTGTRNQRLPKHNLFTLRERFPVFPGPFLVCRNVQILMLEPSPHPDFIWHFILFLSGDARAVVNLILSLHNTPPPHKNICFPLAAYKSEKTCPLDFFSYPLSAKDYFLRIYDILGLSFTFLFFLVKGGEVKL